MKTCVSLVLIVGSLAACATAPDITVKTDPAAKDARGYPQIVDDAALIAELPSLRNAGPRVATCMNTMIFPTQGYIEFAATPTGPHTAEPHRLLCSMERADELRCHEAPKEPGRVLFDRDPSAYFELGKGTDPTSALAIAKAFADDAVELAAKPLTRSLPLRSITAKGDHYEVDFSDCGCVRKMTVRNTPPGSRFPYSAVATHELCI